MLHLAHWKVKSDIFYYLAAGLANVHNNEDGQRDFVRCIDFPELCTICLINRRIPDNSTKKGSEILHFTRHTKAGNSN